MFNAFPSTVVVDWTSPMWRPPQESSNMFKQHDLFYVEIKCYYFLWWLFHVYGDYFMYKLFRSEASILWLVYLFHTCSILARLCDFRQGLGGHEHRVLRCSRLPHGRSRLDCLDCLDCLDWLDTEKPLFPSFPVVSVSQKSVWWVSTIHWCTFTLQTRKACHPGSQGRW